MKITLCGSTKFSERYKEVNLMLSKRGHIVYSVAGFGTEGESLSKEDKEMVDLVHLHKILESDCIVVIGTQENGQPYLGESTNREIRWAKMLGKRVYVEDKSSGMLALKMLGSTDSNAAIRGIL